MLRICIRPEMDSCLGDEDAIDIMEARIEAQGIEWLDWALGKIPPDLYQPCLRSFLPKSRRSTYEYSEPGM